MILKIQLRRITLAQILLTPFMTIPIQAIDFGDNIGRDAANCRALYEEGSVFWN